MSHSVVISIALCLPASDIEALLQGRIIAAISNKFIAQGREFALCPTDGLMNVLPVERYYHSSFLPIAQTAFSQFGTETVSIKASARCELCQIINSAESLAALSSLTIWTQEALQEILTQRQNIFLAYLRVYYLPKAIEVPVKKNSQFVALPEGVTVSQANPVLNDRLFTIRKHQLETRQPPPHPELENLQSAIAFLTITNPAAKQLDQDIKAFLGWTTEELIQQSDPDLAWINDIAALGDRSIEQDKGKSNYQAGTDFENIVRKSLEFLGFTVDYFHKGGAGGVDVFCSKPYPLVAECKAGKKIPNPTAVQLLNLGTLRLQSQELFHQAAKLIIGPGEPTTQLKNAATIQGMSIINPQTLQNLVKLQHNYRGSVDLLKLKEYLKPGYSDNEVDKYIQQVYKAIQLRSHLVQLVKKHQDNTGDKNVEVATLFGAYGYSNPPQPLKIEEIYEILVELSSPLTGYVGRIKGEDWRRDRFYFLRDLPTPQN
ncbi:DUF1802 family protein [Brasilonema bromeliae]|uniref:DUF1802 domain-containing protein n=1 Tax=Brasilonema bromeliae SPC951 TaxID=385972 RepID=A0ABX1P7Y2_9CYAN|nr:DUF1802 family protein [Brasilonema bromeliae]NMG19700.1 DUF1802 domain-containing protein [Brasilonema bromeliae SPC951]